jgi:RNA polymerase sigma factor (sigma-70 family)
LSDSEKGVPASGYFYIYPRPALLQSFLNISKTIGGKAMSKKIKFRPDYSALYPDLDIPADVLAFLKKSDRQMEYQERDLKRDRVGRAADGTKIRLPEREDSLERLLECDWQFPDVAPSPEETMLAQEELDALRCGVASLDENERALVQALFYDGLTEREYAAVVGISQKNVNKKKQRILAKLKKYLAG